MAEKIAIVCALEDEASVNIANHLKRIGVPSWANFTNLKRTSYFLSLNKVKENNIVVYQNTKAKLKKITHCALY